MSIKIRRYILWWTVVVRRQSAMQPRLETCLFFKDDSNPYCTSCTKSRRPDVKKEPMIGISCYAKMNAMNHHHHHTKVETVGKKKVLVSNTIAKNICSRQVGSKFYFILKFYLELRGPLVAVSIFEKFADLPNTRTVNNGRFFAQKPRWKTIFLD